MELGFHSIQLKIERNYAGYDGIQKLKIGDQVRAGNGNCMRLLSTKELCFPDSVYSIEALSWGGGFVANGVVVGVAKPRQQMAFRKSKAD